MTGHAFISYSRSESDFARKLAEGLKAHDVRLWLDVWNIEPAEDWDLAIEGALRDCAIFVIILSPSAVASVEVRGELRAALSNRKRILPILHRSCEIPRQLQTIQYVDLTADAALTDAALVQLAAVISDPSDTLEPLSDERHLQNRRDILNDLKAEVTDRLEPASDAGGALVLLKEKQPHQVHRPWDDAAKVPRVDRPSPPTAMSMVEAFDEPVCARKLLILGEPGSGKSTALLELTSDLMSRAEASADAPLPALVNLCSWRPGPAGLATWIVDEMKLKYGVRKDVTRQWLEERMLAPLLDGLDEVPPENQVECVRALNQFIGDYRPRQLVVCCRLAEYENLGIKLQLGGAIRLLPLGESEVRAYLERADGADLWETIRADPVSMELARAPLFLRMMLLAYREVSPEVWQTITTLAERRECLIDTYIRQLLSAEASGDETPRVDSRRWLAWLAGGLKRQNQEELLIERIQPGWLPTGGQLWMYRLTTLLAGFVVVLLAIFVLESVKDLVPMGAVSTRLFTGETGLVWWARGTGDLLVTAALALIPAGAVAALSSIVPVETLRWSAAKARDDIIYWTRRVAVTALDLGALCGGIAGALVGAAGVYGVDSPWSAATTPSQHAGLIAGTLTGLLGAIALVGASPSAWFRNGSHRWRSTRSADALMVGVVVASGLGPAGAVPGLCVAVMLMFSRRISDASAEGVARAMIVGLVGTLGAAWQFARSSSPPREFLDLWLLSGAGVGGLAAAVWGLRALVFDTQTSAPPVQSWRTLFRLVLARWARWAAVGMLLATVAGAAVALMVRARRLELVQSALLGALNAAQAQSLVLIGYLLFALVIGVAAASMGAFGGALFGTLRGVAGPDVMRRSVPNQGIRQSARNVPVFALIGMVAIGLPYGIVNTVVGGLVARTLPDTRDWLRMGLGSAAYLGLLGGLVPAAACIQHLSLRLAMWVFGLAPLRYGRFLNHATERMLLRRIGGRYRFLHVLLRDRFAQMTLTNPPPGAQSSVVS